MIHAKHLYALAAVFGIAACGAADTQGIDAGAVLDSGRHVALGDAGTTDAGRPVNDAGSVSNDAGSVSNDAGSMSNDAGSTLADAGTQATPLPFDGGWGLPLFRVGVRSTFGHLYGPQTFTGTLVVPRDGGDLGTTALIASRADVATVTLAPVSMGDDWHVSFSVTLQTANSDPSMARELFSLSLPDGGSSFLATGEQNTLHFSFESTALQVLSLAHVREAADPFEEVYHRGIKTGDDPHLDAQRPLVERALRAEWHSSKRVRISARGFAEPESEVFSAVDTALTSSAAPKVNQPTGSNVTSVTAAHAGGQLAVWVGSAGPRPHMLLQGNTQEVSFFLYEGAREEPLYVRQRMPDGGQSAASAVFFVRHTDAGLSSTPSLTLSAAEARACDMSPGNEALFFSSGTELAVAFARARVGIDGCAVLARTLIPASVALLTAVEVNAKGELSDPTAPQFPLAAPIGQH